VELKLNANNHRHEKRREHGLLVAMALSRGRGCAAAEGASCGSPGRGFKSVANRTFPYLRFKSGFP
jgi:hypothetical protein